ncbi:MAG: hypothetical protein ACYC8T_30310 [Myxococcaceae bacterium]
MNSGTQLGTDNDIKRVGKSGQISLGKQHAGQYFREERREDGSIVLVPVVVLSQSHWTVRDEAKIRKALSWAAKSAPKASDLEKLVAGSRKRRGG